MRIILVYKWESLSYNYPIDNEDRSDIKDPSFYTKAIKKIVKACVGDTSTGREVYGVDFWRVGGPIGGYSSEKGKSILVDELEAHLKSWFVCSSCKWLVVIGVKK